VLSGRGVDQRSICFAARVSGASDRGKAGSSMDLFKEGPPRS
jgi:hypothetical protein